MKLRNKKTGEIINSEDLFTDEFIIDLFSRGFSYFDVKIDEIQKVWEVYKDPKEKYFFITWCGDVDDETDDGFDVDMRCKEIGNYFKSKKEAEKAVEKLKAWKRLKDHNLETEKATAIADGRKGKRMKAIIFYANDYDNFLDDIDTCFGGEE